MGEEGVINIVVVVLLVVVVTIAVVAAEVDDPPEAVVVVVAGRQGTAASRYMLASLRWKGSRGTSSDRATSGVAAGCDRQGCIHLGNGTTGVNLLHQRKVTIYIMYFKRRKGTWSHILKYSYIIVDDLVQGHINCKNKLFLQEQKVSL